MLTCVGSPPILPALDQVDICFSRSVGQDLNRSSRSQQQFSTTSCCPQLVTNLFIRPATSSTAHEGERTMTCLTLLGRLRARRDARQPLRPALSGRLQLEELETRTVPTA